MGLGLNILQDCDVGVYEHPCLLTYDTFLAQEWT